ncbi:MAG: ATP phosphoribosyltransferase regulatory subunit [Rhodospirillales bacterium]|nr:ATP phosphoribosyltransferase regulatory subunit [Rhodospirillales bacterium]MCB9965632.1 ATP phosphoribosyltransferase regulatory subunit [Rhodospirillales bacterium]MCB9973055.1 ATP phosphoribosyltransferase regulatory subunit [Rhodospirillales bacterium]
MTSQMLLPNGLTDLLPDIAEQEAETVYTLMQFFKRHGYRRVKPPLIEFEDSLLSGPGQSTGAHMFRVMDPASQKMMGLRADITPQIARIAASRFDKSAYPLRLSYTGDVFHVKGTQLDPTRQMTQVGCELIGDNSHNADIENIMLVLSGLKEIGLKTLTLDLTLPALIQDILGDQRSPEIMDALKHKNREHIAKHGGAFRDILLTLMDLSGNAGDALQHLEKIEAPAFVTKELTHLRDVVLGVQKALEDKNIDDVALTLDPTEHSPFNYHRGISYSLYVKGVRHEIGRGGRYSFRTDTGSETAIGFTIYMNALRRML